LQDFLQFSASELVAKIKSKALSSVEVVQAHIERINAINPKINAVQQLHVEQALQQAKQADAALVKGKSLGKLHGLPISFKDTAYVKDFRVSRGSKLFYGDLATQDCTVAARLKAAGAIILAMTNVPELLMRYQTDNVIYGRTNNPHDLSRTPGGSSGGEAALIAACGSPLGIGSDFGGSIRMPASNCGIAGIKPTQMLVPNSGNFPIDTAGVILNCATMGPMARYVKDLTLCLSIIAGRDGYDPYVPPVTLGDPDSVDMKKLKLAYFNSDGINAVDEEVAKTLANVVQALRTEVDSLEERVDECLQDILRVHFETTVLSDDRAQGLTALFNDLPEKDISAFTQDTIRLLKTKKIDTTTLRRQLLEAQQFPFKLMRAYHDIDVIISPVSSYPAVKHGIATDKLTDFTFVQLFNIAGWPAAVVRCGTSREGLPIGVQIAAKPWCDHIALAVAGCLEEIFHGWQMPPL